MESVSTLETAMCVLLVTFQKYAADQGKKDTLTQAEAKTLLKKELPVMFKAENAEVDEVLKNLDVNGDKEIDFSEFMVLVASLTCACHELFMTMQCPKK